MIDRAIEATPRITEAPDRADELKHIMKMTMDDLPYIPLYVEHNVCAYSNSLQWQPRPDEYISLKDIHFKN